MYPYFIWKSISSLDKKIMVNKLPDFERPPANIEKIVIPGRDGFLTQDDGTYQGTVKTCECSLDNGNIDDVCSWLTGCGDVIFSNEPDKKYKATIINKIPFSKIIPTFHSFIIQFDCQPYKYGTAIRSIDVIGKNMFDKSKVTDYCYPDVNTGVLVYHPTVSTSEFVPVLPSTQYIFSGVELPDNTPYVWFDENKAYISGSGNMLSAVTSPSNAKYIRFAISIPYLGLQQLELGTVATAYEPTHSGAIFNSGTATSKPIVKVYGTGTINLTINSTAITLTNVVDYVTIDSELMDCYKGTVLKNNDMSGDFPILAVGTNTINWSGTVTSVEITPNWRHL